MWHCSVSALSFCFILFLLIPTQNTSYALALDLINTTCKQCVAKSTILHYDFCLTSLQAIPISHFTNLQGLAVVAMELATLNATDTLSTIEKMVAHGVFDPFAVRCLGDCLELYTDAVAKLLNSVAAFLSENFDTANLLMRAVMESAAACEEGFMTKEGEATPLTEENYNLLELSDIALCIISLLSSQITSIHT